jgi:benzodiazapine receptor
MDRDLRRQLVNLIAYLVTVAFNGLAVALPLNGLTTGEISDRFPVLVTPADYVFSIWSVIYLLLGAFTIWQVLPRNRADDTLRSIGYLPALAGALNALWVVLWHYEVFALTVPVMLGLLLTLIAIHVRLRTARAAGGARRWMVALPFSVYLGWITVATIANISQMLYHAGYRGEPLGEELWTIIVLGTGVVIAAAMSLREADRAYGLVIIWAYVGIAAEQTEPVAVIAALAGAIVVGALLAYAIARARDPRPSASPSEASIER